MVQQIFENYLKNTNTKGAVKKTTIRPLKFFREKNFFTKKNKNNYSKFNENFSKLDITLARIKLYPSYAESLKNHYFFSNAFYLGPFKSNGTLAFTKVRRNHVFSISDLSGNTLGVVSTGKYAARRKFRLTPRVFELTTKALLTKIRARGIKHVVLKLFFAGRKNKYFTRIVLRNLIAGGIGFVFCAECLPRPHNGCRPKNMARK